MTTATIAAIALAVLLYLGLLFVTQRLGPRKPRPEPPQSWDRLEHPD